MAEKASETAIVETTPTSLQLSEAAIQITKHNIALCQQLVSEVLEKDIDWGTIPGVPQPFLFDSGAAKIMAAFNCYAKYTLLEKTDTSYKLAFTFESQLINRNSGEVIATGIGACSTTEKKYRYIWKEQGAEAEQLLNNIAKMAAKRADIDAVQSLPGVAATLRKLFTRQGQKNTSHNWNWFWAQLNTYHISPEEAHKILGVASLKEDWVGTQGKTLEEALSIIRDAITPPGANPEKGKEE